MKNIKTIVCVILMTWICGFALTSCGNNDDEVVNAKDIVLSTDELVFLAESTESQTVTFTANADWRATSEQGWIVIDTPVGKAGESSLSVSVKQNPNKTERQGNVIITEPSTGKMASFKVKQGAEGVNFVVEKETGELAVNEEAQTISETVKVAANFDYDVQIKDVDWITYSEDKASGSVTFYADAAEVPTGAQEITINFVPTEEEVEAQSWTLNWPGFTPSVTFYKDQECTQPIGEDGIEIESTLNVMQAMIYTKSNVPWSINTDLNGTILAGIDYKDNTDEFPRVFESTSSFFAVYNTDKLSKTDQEIVLSCKYEGNGESKVKVVKKGTGNLIQLDATAFESLKGGDDLVGDYFCPMFAATGDNLSLEFSVKTFENPEDLDVLFMEYDYNTQTCLQRSQNKNIQCKYIESSKSGEMNVLTYRLTLPDRSIVEGEDGDDRYFQMFIKPKSLDFGSFMNTYFVLDERGMRFDETKTNEIGNIVFGQLAYQKLFTFNPVWYTVGAATEPTVESWNNKTFEISAAGGVIKIAFESSANVENNEVVVSDETMVSDDQQYITQYNEFWGDDILSLTNFTRNGQGEWIFDFTVSPNTSSNNRNKEICLGGRLSGNQIQYFGKFTINQAAATTGE